MRIEKRNYKTDDHGYRYSVQSAITDDTQQDIGAFELTVEQPGHITQRSGDRGWAMYYIIKECIDDFGLREGRLHRRYNDDGTVTVFGS